MGGNQDTRFGKFELLERLSAGALATVYRARDPMAPDSDRSVVVKRIRTECSQDPEFLQKVRKAAHLSMMSRHDHAAQVREFGSLGGECFLVREWVDGHGLPQMRNRFARTLGVKWLPAPVAVRIAIGMCRGLHHVHTTLGLRHPELAPDAVLLGFDGEVKVCGFELHWGMLSAEAQVHLAAGAFRSKISCVSPEQVTGTAPDVRSDVYLAGLVLYQMLCGALHIEADSDFERLQQIREGRLIPAREHNPSLDDGLVAILQRAMESRPEDRYPSAEAMEQALSRWFAAHTPGLHHGAVGHWLCWLYQDELARRGRGFSLPLGFLAQVESWRASAQAGRSTRPSA